MCLRVNLLLSADCFVKGSDFEPNEAELAEGSCICVLGHKGPHETQMSFFDLQQSRAFYPRSLPLPQVCPACLLFFVLFSKSLVVRVSPESGRGLPSTVPILNPLELTDSEASPLRGYFCRILQGDESSGSLDWPVAKKTLIPRYMNEMKRHRREAQSGAGLGARTLEM